MSQKHTYTTANHITWEAATNPVRKLYCNEDFRMSLFIGCSIFFGLRMSDLLPLKWSQILGNDELVIVEKKTDKRRVIRINGGFKDHIMDCYRALDIQDMNKPCFLNRYGNIISLQMINRHLKEIKVKYQLWINNFYTHSLRKMRARKVYGNENAQRHGEMALLKPSEIMNSLVALPSRDAISI